jgi:hypothetical protein
VHDKSDKQWHTCLLKFHDHCRQLCCLRHLLVFVHCMNLLGAEGSTHLFPNKATLMARTSSSPVETCTGDASYLEGLDWLEKGHGKPFQSHAFCWNAFPWGHFLSLGCPLQHPQATNEKECQTQVRRHGRQV